MLKSIRRAIRAILKHAFPNMMERREFNAIRQYVPQEEMAKVPNDVVTRVRALKDDRRRTGHTYSHNPKFAAIVTSFNQAWNVRTLAARLTNNPHVSEIVVCEDGSIDGSLEEWVRCLSGQNHFIVRANDLHEIRVLDRALRLSRAEVCCIIQDDDVVPEDSVWVEEALALFDKHPRLGVLGGFMAYKDPPTVGQDFALLKKTSLHGRSDFQFVASVAIGPYYVRATCYSQCGGFDVSFSDPGQAGVGFDEEFGFRAWLNGWQVGYLYQPFKTGKEGVYHFGTGGTFLYGQPADRLSHDRENKRKIVAAYGRHYHHITEVIRRSNAALFK